MIRYQCNYCNVAFDEPTTITYSENLGENMTRVYKEDCCPICGCDSFRDAIPCEQCGDAAEPGEILCNRCKRSLKKRIVAFFDTFTAEEELQFDAWIDGDVIENRRNWK